MTLMNVSGGQNLGAETRSLEIVLFDIVFLVLRPTAARVASRTPVPPKTIGRLIDSTVLSMPR
jgi:hypothetical protein